MKGHLKSNNFTGNRVDTIASISKNKMIIKQKRRGMTGISIPCQKGNHGQCFSLTCNCTCGHYGGK